MKVCIVGAGSIGGMMGVKMHNAGEDVTLVDRGPHLEAIKTNGLKLIMNDGTKEVAKGAVATDDISSVEVQDLVVLGVKSHQIAPIVDQVAGLLGPQSTLLTVQNGILWWYFQRLGGKHDNRTVESVDPGGVLKNGIDPKNILGTITYPAAEIIEPGVIRHIEGFRFPVGELDKVETERTNRIADLLNRSGFKSFVIEDIRAETWLKLLGNLTFNPISALTHATLIDICRHEPARKLVDDMMTECREVASRLGVEIRLSNERRIEGAESVGKHKTSMLQDIEAGRSLELEGLIGTVVEFGKLTGVPTPNIDAVYALIRLLDHMVRTENICVRASPNN